MRKVLGHNLTIEDQETVLSAHVHSSVAPRQFSDAEEWLCNTTFLVRNDGCLDDRFQKQVSRPTWPNNPELWKVQK